MGGKGKEVLRMTHKFLAQATGWILIIFPEQKKSVGGAGWREEGEFTFWHRNLGMALRCAGEAERVSI